MGGAFPPMVVQAGSATALPMLAHPWPGHSSSELPRHREELELVGWHGDGSFFFSIGAPSSPQTNQNRLRWAAPLSSESDLLRLRCGVGSGAAVLPFCSRNRLAGGCGLRNSHLVYYCSRAWAI